MIVPLRRIVVHALQAVHYSVAHRLHRSASTTSADLKVCDHTALISTPWRVDSSGL